MDPPQSAASPDSDSPQAAAAREAHPIRRQLDENRWKNQKKRVAWEQAKEESIGICREFIGDFVKCTEGKTFSVIWSCRPHNNWMTTCMKT
jgi:hypothetical protein